MHDDSEEFGIDESSFYKIDSLAENAIAKKVNPKIINFSFWYFL